MKPLFFFNFNFVTGNIKVSLISSLYFVTFSDLEIAEKSWQSYLSRDKSLMTGNPYFPFVRLILLSFKAAD